MTDINQTDDIFDLDNLDNALSALDNVTVEGGVDTDNDDSCPGGACKI